MKATAQNNLLNHEDQLQKFLLGRMHHYKALDYHTPQQRKRKHYELDNNENKSDNSSIIDLRISSDKKISPRKSTLELLNLKKKIELPKKYNKNSLFPGGDMMKNCQTISENVRRTMLLKKMLQAPAGTNLKNIANIDNFYRFIVANKNLSDKNFYSTPSNNSDTLTADSESNTDEHPQWNQTYYLQEKNRANPMNMPDVKFPLLDINQSNLIKNQYNNPGYSMNQSEGNNPGYNYNHLESQDWKNLYQNDVQENCKKWLTNTMDVTNEINPMSNMTSNKNLNMIYSTMYSPQQSNNNIPDTNCYSTLVHQDNQQEYLQNLQTISNQERVRVERTPGEFCAGYIHQNYQENNNIIQDKNDAAKDQRFYQYNQEVWSAGNGQEDVGAADNIWGTSGYNFNGNGYDNDCYIGNNQDGYYQGNDFEGNLSGQQQGLMESTGSSENTLNSIDSSSFLNGYYFIFGLIIIGVFEFLLIDFFYFSDVLKPYWPRRIMPARNVQDVTSSNSQIEHILNLRHAMEVDDSKLNQTSATYCYSAPILTPGPSSSSNCSQKIRLIAETRKHLFTTQYLLYNDSSTGLNLSNIDYLNKNLDKSDYQDVFMNQDDILSSNYWEYMNKNIMANSDSEGPVRRDVWFSNHFDNDPINYSLCE